MSSQQKNLALTYKSHPTQHPVPGEHLTVENVDFDPSSPAPSGGIVLEHLYASFDPYMRGRMRDESVKSYFPPFTVNQPMTSATIARVLKSDNADFSKGDIVTGLYPIQQYSAVAKPDASKKLAVENQASDLREHLGALGMPGLTAFASLYEIGKPQKGETIFVSSAAGAVGQIVGQIAKNEGLRVVGSVGSDDKLAHCVDDLAFDGCFNYKTERAADALARLAPHGVDIYYENVGGEQLAAALDAMNDHGRIVACGMVSQYNLPDADKYGVKNLFQIIMKRLTMQGFIVSDGVMGGKWGAEHKLKMVAWLKGGTFKTLTHETVGMRNAADGFVGMLKGENFGKAVLKIKE